MQGINKLKDQIIVPLIRFRIIFSVIFTTIYFIGCSNDVTTIKDEDNATDKPVADVISVSVKGDPNAYEFSVGILSPDTGCDQYADWWEVLTENGALIYRRILAHSHVDEQPFIRSGRPVPIDSNEIVYIRAHMHPGGYGSRVYKGSVQDGFQEVTLRSEFATGVENEDPQPDGCAF